MNYLFVGNVMIYLFNYVQLIGLNNMCFNCHFLYFDIGQSSKRQYLIK